MSVLHLFHNVFLFSIDQSIYSSKWLTFVGETPSDLVGLKWHKLVGEKKNTIFFFFHIATLVMWYIHLNTTSAYENCYMAFSAGVTCDIANLNKRRRKQSTSHNKAHIKNMCFYLRSHFKIASPPSESNILSPKRNDTKASFCLAHNFYHSAVFFFCFFCLYNVKPFDLNAMYRRQRWMMVE